MRGPVVAVAVVALGFVACRPGPATAPAPGGASPALIASEVEPPYPPPAPGAMAPACTTVLPATDDPDGAGGHKIYEFSAIEFPAVPWGPRIRDMPAAGRPRSPRLIADALAELKGPLHACYRWARWRDRALEGIMTVTYELDPFGAVADVAVADRAGWGDLATCVEALLPTVPATTFVPRRTRVSATLGFTPSGQGRTPRRPRPPWRATPAPALGCMRAPPTPPLDEVRTPAVIVSDFSEDQASLERQEAACRASGARHCRVALPTDRGGGMAPRMIVVGDHDKRMIRDHLGYNRGAFGACWAAARARRPDASGVVTLVMQLQPDGRTEAVAIEHSTAGDPRLEACLRDALDEVWLPPTTTNRATTVHLPMVAAPTTPTVPPLPPRAPAAAVLAGADAALAAGDGVTAARRYAAVLAQAPSCAARVGLVRALRAARPWIDDGVVAAADELAGAPAAATCTAELAPQLLALAVVAHVEGEKLHDPERLELAVDRYQRVLRLPGLAAAADDAVRGYLAHALGELDRDVEAAAVLPAGASAQPPRGVPTAP